MAGLRVITPPSVEPVSVDEVKAQARVDLADEDALIQGYIRAARETLERLLWRAFITQTLELTLDGWPEGSEIRLPRPPLQSVTAVRYITEDGTLKTLDPALYVVDTASEPGRVVLKRGKSWPSETLAPAAGVKVEYVAGYGDQASDVPEPIRQAILLLAAHWYEHREAVSEGQMVEVPMGVWWLVEPLRMAGVA